MSTLTLDGQTYALDQLAQVNPTTHSAEAAAALDFCRRWLAGQTNFEIHTSGSTGVPKRIVLHRRQMIASARRTGTALSLQAGMRALVCLSANYIAGQMMLVRGLELGLHLTVVHPSRRPLAAPADTEAPFDFAAMVPLQLQATLNSTPTERQLLDKMQAVLIGGAPVKPALLAQCQAVAAPLYHTYGMTETVSHVALRRLNGPQPDDCFVALPGVELGLDERGCLTIRADVTAGKTIITNDLVELHGQGRFTWRGRIDNVINTGGVKVQLEDVERAIEHSLPRLDLAERRFCVGALPDDDLGQRLVAVVEGAPFTATQTDQLRAAVQAQVGRYATPKQIAYLPQLPETRSGKIDRQAALAALT